MVLATITLSNTPVYNVLHTHIHVHYFKLVQQNSKTLQLFTSLHSCHYLSKGMLLAQVPERCITMQQ